MALVPSLWQRQLPHLVADSSQYRCTGVALGKCVEYGYSMAKDVAQYLEGDGTASHIAEPSKTQDDSFYQGEVPVTSGFQRR